MKNIRIKILAENKPIKGLPNVKVTVLSEESKNVDSNELKIIQNYYNKFPNSITSWLYPEERRTEGRFEAHGWVYFLPSSSLEEGLIEGDLYLNLSNFTWTKGIKMGFLDRSKQDIKKAGIRVAGNQLNKLIINVILSLLKKEGFNKKSELSTIERFLNTKWGLGCVSLFSGQLLTFAPYLKDNDRVQQLAEELRVNGYATAGNELVDFVQENFLSEIMNVVKMLPENEEPRLDTPKKRVRIDAETNFPSLHDGEDEHHHTSRRSHKK